MGNPRIHIQNISTGYIHPYRKTLLNLVKVTQERPKMAPWTGVDSLKLPQSILVCDKLKIHIKAAPIDR